MDNRNMSKRVRKPAQAMRIKQAELKQLDGGLLVTALNVSPAPNSPALYQVPTVCGMATGTGSNTREGLQIQARTLKLSLSVSIGSHSAGAAADMTATGTVFRIVVYKDTVSSGATPTWADLFDTTPNNASQEYDFPTLHYRKRFKILHDQFVTVPPSYVVLASPTYHAFGNKKNVNITIPLNHQIWYNDTSSSIGSITEGNIGFFVASDATANNYTPRS